MEDGHHNVLLVGLKNLYGTRISVQESQVLDSINLKKIFFASIKRDSSMWRI